MLLDKVTDREREREREREFLNMPTNDGSNQEVKYASKEQLQSGCGWQSMQGHIARYDQGHEYRSQSFAKANETEGQQDARI